MFEIFHFSGTFPDGTPRNADVVVPGLVRPITPPGTIESGFSSSSPHPTGISQPSSSKRQTCEPFSKGRLRFSAHLSASPGDRT